MDIYYRNLNLLLPTWLRKIGETYLAEATRIYNSLNIPFETSWFPVFLVLNKHHQVTISQIAEILNVSQPAVSQVVAALHKKGLVTMHYNSKDGRKKDIVLSEAGAELMYRLEPVWTCIDRSMEQILHTHPLTKELGDVLRVLEEQMRGRLHHSVMGLLADRPFKIKPWDRVNDPDLYNILHRTEGVEFIFPDNAAKVFLAQADSEVLGAIAVEKQTEDEYILHNLYVRRDHRLKGIAKSLLERAIPQEHKVCIIMDRATPELVDILLKCSYSFKVDISTE